MFMSNPSFESRNKFENLSEAKNLISFKMTKNTVMETSLGDVSNAISVERPTPLKLVTNLTAIE